MVMKIIILTECIYFDGTPSHDEKKKKEKESLFGTF
jgi:hypothetical protein